MSQIPKKSRYLEYYSMYLRAEQNWKVWDNIKAMILNILKENAKNKQQQSENMKRWYLNNK